MNRKTVISHAHAAKRKTISVVARHVAFAACIVAWCASDALAARRKPEALVADSAARSPATQALKKPKAGKKLVKASRKTHRKAKAARRPDVFYRWSDEQLMLGGVSPSQIGKRDGDAYGKQTSKGAASSK
ncbi:hypothetical protein PPGU19_047290 [Paraburkholderia sp. PGU19]|uniref:hypothetical protein n=1 Tax=Paraburkholderia sp. PGU19 TaxID=2735434 RepID=UPI0015DBABD5|nr:hypothetical protein [Paraburkholderia sp. PGU19]BCG00161.1 hypothetical protein PPGU19_047290 [Paraburkholderia sp. PGU19]